MKQFLKRLFTPRTPEERAKTFVNGITLDYLPVANKYSLRLYEENDYEATYWNFNTKRDALSWIEAEVEKRYGVGIQGIKL